MSGFEVAGIVLATLPLIINALEHYAKGVETVARWRKYAAGVTSLILAVKTQRTIFTNTLEQLLTGIVRADDMMDVLKDAGGEAWRTADIHNQLKDRLRDAYSAYVGNVEEMHKALKAMMENLALDPSGQVQSQDLSRFEQERKRLGFSLRKSAYAEQVAQLERLNSVLAQLTSQSRDLQPTRATSRRCACPNFASFQDSARAVYDALSSGLRCVRGCQGHAVKLRLEYRDSRAGNSEQEIPFHFVFNQTSTSQWRELDIRCIKEQAKRIVADSCPASSVGTSQPTCKRVRFGSPVKQTRKDQNSRTVSTTTFTTTAATMTKTTTATTTAVQQPTTFVLKALPIHIQSLCAALANIPRTQPQADSCLGYVQDTKQRKHGIYADSVDKHQQHSWSSLSLRQILSGQASIGQPLTRYDKLQTAVQLAYSILQLYNTPWLDEKWTKDDVHFVKKPSSEARELYKHPYVKRDFSANCNNTATQAQQTKSRLIRNQTLFTLGVLLIEIWYGKSIGKLHTTDDLDCANTPGPDWCAADRLVRHELEYEAGKTYKEAVRRCLQCDFNSPDGNLNDHEVQKAVFEGVVLPLETTFKQFKGQL